MTYVGSQPSASSACAAIDAVVVLPCVPAMAIVRRRRLSSPSSAPRWITRSSRSRAATYSGFAGGIAVDTTSSMSWPTGTLAASWPTTAGIPAARTRSRYGELARSEPVTAAPRASAISASPLIPAPPMPTKCSRRPDQSAAPAPVPARALIPPARRRRGSEHRVGDRLRRVRPGQRGRRARHRGQPRRIAEQRADLAAQARGRQLGVGHDDGRAGLLPSSARWQSGGRRSRADRARGSPACRPRRSRRSSRRRARRTGRRRRAPRRSRRCRGAGRSARRRRGVRARRGRACPAACSTRKGAARNASTAASLIVRAPSEPPKTSTQVSSACRPKRARAAAGSVAGAGTGRPVTR